MKVYISWKYKHPKKLSCPFHSDFLDAKEALMIAEDLERTGRVSSIEFYDEQDVVWQKKELTKLLTEIKEEPQDVTVYFDGGFLKEEGVSGLGIVIYYTQNNKHYRRRINKCLHELESSNESEYAAFYEALINLENMGVHHQTCEFKGDSQVVLNQLSGEWACFDDTLNKWCDRIEEKMKASNIHPKYTLIGRKENREADMLASQAIAGTEIDSELNVEK
ncbi:MAG: reverse transcriptase-like protein [Bacillus sp. (in: firmicutes)]